MYVNMQSVRPGDRKIPVVPFECFHLSSDSNIIIIDFEFPLNHRFHKRLMCLHFISRPRYIDFYFKFSSFNIIHHFTKHLFPLSPCDLYGYKTRVTNVDQIGKTF